MICNKNCKIILLVLSSYISISEILAIRSKLCKFKQATDVWDKTAVKFGCFGSITLLKVQHYVI